MTLNEFKSTMRDEQPPETITPLLLALWHDGRGDWEKAHELAQEVDDEAGAWVHAYLHRKEGDLWNADYWYRRAGRSRPGYDLDQEWEVIVENLL